MNNAQAERLDQLPHGYPATDTGVELKISRKIFSSEEAEMALKLKYFPETADAIAERLGEPVEIKQYCGVNSYKLKEVVGWLLRKNQKRFKTLN